MDWLKDIVDSTWSELFGGSSGTPVVSAFARRLINDPANPSLLRQLDEHLARDSVGFSSPRYDG